ncbi:hypothetical protein AUR64_14740 [Haloprofundus marisrubri]|uniref:Uncharacterized protein n=1 Tax=Haloprofundus marisrubri TaxID=1514971 RepID=A0A0W1R767_9EURY|nr:hypothetical protein [Haloprofundus marisrubri]KTG09056.1 hypothetical protein AUR64_14740 [Haloprofundus marisrubri]
MVLHRHFLSLVVLLTLVPTPALAQSGVEAPAVGSGLADLAVILLLLALLVVINAAFSVALGIPVLLVSEFVYSNSYVRAIESRIHDAPVRSGGLGIAATIGGIVGLVVFAIVVTLLTDAGLPDAVGLVLVIPVLVGVLFVYVGSAVSTVVVGLYLLRRVGTSESNLWAALVVGAVLVNIPLLGFFISLPVFLAALGAMVSRLWNSRRNDSSGPGRQRPVDGPQSVTHESR